MDLGRIMPMGRDEALRKYGEMGFLVRFAKDGSLTYPSAAKLDSQISALCKRLGQIDTQLCEMKDGTIPLPQGIARLADPLWWEHNARLFLDGEYRGAYGAVKPPMEMLENAKGRRIFSSFMRSREYQRSLRDASEIGLSKPFSGANRMDGVAEAQQGRMVAEKEQLVKKLRCLTAVRALAR